MATCKVPNCPNEGLDVAVERVVATPSGAITIVCCMNCALKLMYGKVSVGKDET